MGKPTDLNLLEYGKFAAQPGMRPHKKPIRVIGFDTETGKDGNIIVLACSDGSFDYGDPYGDSLRFLLKPDYYGAFNFFFNLGFDHNALFRSICGTEQLTELVRCGRTYVRGVQIDFIPGKLLKLRNHNKVWRYWDISRFYKGGSSGRLVDVYKSVFGEEYVKGMDASKGFDVIDEQVVQYCVEDAKACQRLSENLVMPTNRLVPMRTWYSGATIAKNMRKQNLVKPYRFRQSRLQQFAMNCYGGARIEVFQRGSWGIADNDRLYMYDIRSAYPSVQCGLYDVTGGASCKTPEYIPEASHSFFLINIRIEECVVGPLKFRFGGAIFYPIGDCADIWVDKNELELLMEYDVQFQIIKAAHELSSQETQPYAYLKDMYQERLRCKKSDSLAERQLDFPRKLALNSSYGMLIERTAKYSFCEDFTPEQQGNEDNYLFTQNGQSKLAVASWKAGAFFNPVHACEVTSAIRCKLYRDSAAYEDNLIKFATDSMTFDKPIKLDFGEALGQYEDSPAYRGIVLGCGVYSLEAKDKRIQRYRSFSSLDLNVLASENPNVSAVDICRTGPVKLREAMADDFEYFNTFQEKHKMLDINFDKRRNWVPEKLKDFSAVMAGHYRSSPIDFSQLRRKGVAPKADILAEIDTDLVDYKALYDSSLTRAENRQIALNMIIKDNIRF